MRGQKQRLNRQQTREKSQRKKKQYLSKRSEQELMQNIEDLQKYIFNTQISSIDSYQQVQTQYYPTNSNNRLVKNTPKNKLTYSQHQIPISSMRNDRENYHKSPISPQSEQMVLVPKRKLIKLFQQVKMLKKALKSQKRMMDRELQSLRYGVQDLNKEKAIILKQKQYLKDMQRCASESKISFYKTEPKFYSKNIEKKQ